MTYQISIDDAQTAIGPNESLDSVLETLFWNKVIKNYSIDAGVLTVELNTRVDLFFEAIKEMNNEPI